MVQKRINLFREFFKEPPPTKTLFIILGMGVIFLTYTLYFQFTHKGRVAALEKSILDNQTTLEKLSELSSVREINHFALRSQKDWTPLLFRLTTLTREEVNLRKLEMNRLSKVAVCKVEGEATSLVQMKQWVSSVEMGLESFSVSLENQKRVENSAFPVRFTVSVRSN